MHVMCIQNCFEKWNNSELWLLLGIRNIIIILMMLLMILILMIIYHDENEVFFNTRLMYVNFFINTCRLRGDILKKCQNGQTTTIIFCISTTRKKKLKTHRKNKVKKLWSYTLVSWYMTYYVQNCPQWRSFVQNIINE